MAAEPAELQVDATEGPDEEEPERLGFNIASYPADYTVKVLVEKWRDGQLVIPDFQRDYVWTQPQASRLIESFLLGLPVPQVFLYKERTSPQLLVVDGQQRLSTLVQFYDGQFRGERIFRLQGVHQQWHGRSYRELSDDDRMRLDDATLRSIVVQQLAPDDQSSIYLIFERLNTGGTQLTPMEVRKSVFHGQAYELVHELNRDGDWRLILGTPVVDRRLRDEELVLRVLAMAAGWTSYFKPMKTFLTAYMDGLTEVGQDELQSIRQRFVAACARIVEELGDRPFHLRGRLNVAALDCMTACAMDFAGPIGALSHCFTTLMNTEAFRDAVYFNTSDAAVVRRRFELFGNCLGVDANSG